MKRIFAFIFIIIVLCIITACNKMDFNNKETADTLFNVPDFDVKPNASGDSITTTLDEMLVLVEQYNPPLFSFVDELNSSTQTVYDENFENGSVLEEENNLSILGSIPSYLTKMDFVKFKGFHVDDFDVSNDNKIYYLHTEKLPTTFNDYTITDFAIDVSTKSIIVRGVISVEEEDATETAYLTTTICFDGDSYKTSFVTYEMINSANSEYSIESNVQFVYSTKNNEITNGQYNCTQATVMRVTSINEETEEEIIQYATEHLMFDIDIRTIDGYYNVTRNIELKQTSDSFSPEDALLVYEAEQIITYEEGRYVLKEIATGFDSDGNEQTATQYIVYS